MPAPATILSADPSETPVRTSLMHPIVHLPRRHRAALIAPAALTALGLLLSGCGDSGPKENAEASPTAATAQATPAADAPTPTALPIAATAAQPGGNAADEDWNKLQELFTRPPEPPAEWATNKPDQAAIQAFQLSRGETALKVADAAHDFYTKYPNDARAEQARGFEVRLLDAAIQLGKTNVLTRLETLESKRMKDPATTEDDRFEIRLAAAQRAASLLIPQGHDVARAALEKSAQDLIREFPARSEPYQLLLNLASEAPAEKARDMVKPLVSTNAPEEVRTAAQSLLDRIEMVGKPLDLKFAALDGTQIDLADRRGKVVLIDFWATWCGPCVAELPNVKAAYERLHPKGFEILGISFDHEKDDLVQFIDRQKMTWPQYFDGKGWENVLGQRFGIQAIPTMWLIDKKGVLRDINGRDDLESKVTTLLAEADPPKANQ